ncbi:hypothetical protein HC031_10345 [Planosporangium thailandense]|uniref:Glycosyltransferase RgtA/B/C/D-like domain-containing protein n=1 Tax=Planosporangium thailandense TaxID=765197 RepID=A0ABX0XW95_9ACTN|nr:hypothetical protein [Planosporangium thailandense]NJC70106.1 hypothetical protein [Planosporangium thailandense]
MAGRPEGEVMAGRPEGEVMAGRPEGEVMAGRPEGEVIAGRSEGATVDRDGTAGVLETDHVDPDRHERIPGEYGQPLNLVGRHRAPEVPAVVAQAAPAATPRRVRVRWVLLGVLLVVGVLAAIARLPWEWSFIDDSALLDVVNPQVRAHGPVGGFVTAAYEMYRIDLTWGLFRPAYWLYVAGFYQLPVGVAHAIRVAMLVTVFVGAVSAVVDRASGQRRAVLTAWTLLAVAANGALFMGIWYPSLQELSALCFVGLGLVARRRPWLLFACWLVAAWFKSPFAWLLLAHGLLLCRRRSERVVGVVMTVSAVATLGGAAVLARTGQYTTAGTQLSLKVMHAHADTALGLLGAPALVVLAGALVFGSRLDRGRDPLAWSLLAGGAGYLVNLLPWRTDAHYASPYLFLVTVGALVALRDVDGLAPRRALAGLVVPLLLSGAVVSDTALNGWSTLTNVTGLRDCVRGLPARSVVGFNRAEAWARLDAIVRAHDPGWTGRVVLVPDGQTAGQVGAERVDRIDYYIHQASYGPGTPALMAGAVVCRTRQSTVYRVR